VKAAMVRAKTDKHSHSSHRHIPLSHDYVHHAVSVMNSALYLEKSRCAMWFQIGQNGKIYPAEILVLLAK